jgi:CotH protein/lamin tail-like protein
MRMFIKFCQMIIKKKTAYIIILFSCLIFLHLQIFCDDQDIVINEIMYHPERSEDEEFIEICNRGTITINLSNWQFSDGIEFTFPTGTEITPQSYLVIAKDAAIIKKKYGILNVTGNYEGKLKNSGEKIELRNSSGMVIDEITFDDEGRWDQRADGSGASIELINPHTDNSFPDSWKASIPLNKGGWQYITLKGIIPDNQTETFYFMLMGEGECLIDDVRISPEGRSQNLIQNGNFENIRQDWQDSGNHIWSEFITYDSHDGYTSMKIIATGPGTGWENSVTGKISGAVKDQNCDISFYVKSLEGTNQLACRFSWGEIIETISMQHQGTPGKINSCFTVNPSPLIYDVTHTPLISPPKNEIRFQTEILSSSPIISVRLFYSGTEGNFTSIPMHDNGIQDNGIQGDNIYGVKIDSGESSNTYIRYYIEAVDSENRISKYPPLNSRATYKGVFIYDNEIQTDLPLYSLYISPENVERIEMNKENDDYSRGTFVAGGIVYPDVNIRYRGGSARWYDSGKMCYKVRFPENEPFNEIKTINLNACYPDKSFIRERLGYELCRKIEIPYCETRFVTLSMNSEYYGIYLQVENPNMQWIKRNDMDPDGNLFKSYSDFKKEQNHWNYFWKFQRETNITHSYDDIIGFLENINDLPEAEIKEYLEANLDLEKFAKYLVVMCVINNSDHLAKNYYVFRGTGENDKWFFTPWDLDLTFGRRWIPDPGVLNDEIRYDNHILFGSEEYQKIDNIWNRLIDRFLKIEEFRILYRKILRDFLESEFNEEKLYPEIDFLKSILENEIENDWNRWPPYGIKSTHNFDYQISIIKNFIMSRKNYILGQLNKPVSSWMIY